MSSATPSRKPPTPGVGINRRPSANPTPKTETPSRSPTRMTTQVGSGTANGINRTRSVRAGTPTSARAAARRPGVSDDPSEMDAKAELLAKMDDLQEQLRQAELATAEAQKQAAALQVKLDETNKERSMLEETVHEQIERVEEMKNEHKESLRARRELEQHYEADRAAAMKEKEASQIREEEMQHAMQRMKATLAQREMRHGLDDDRRPSLSRNSSFRNSANPSPNPENGQFAPPSALQRSDSRSSSRLVMQKDKEIEGLRLELADAQIKLIEVANMGGSRTQELERTMYDVKMQNARLIEENESFQLLLSEKTLNGELAQSELLRPPSSHASRPPSRRAPGTSLADELGNETDTDAGDLGDMEKRLQAEVNSLKDQNKALTLYVNNIISRLLQHDQFEAILDKTPDIMAGPGAASRRFQAMTADRDKDLPPPPAEKDASEKPDQPTGLLQRAKSVMGGRRPRPQSQILQPAESHEQDPKAEVHTVHSNPQTAPQVPLGRSRSHRRANSEWATASIVNNMYRGPSPGLGGPASPGLSSPTARTSFFAAPQPLGVHGTGLGSRVPSGSSIPTVPPKISENDANKENRDVASHAPSLQQQQRDSNISSRNSVVSNPDGELSNPSSPPRSTTSSGDRDKRAAGAIMMGSKPRPLRLVQDAAEQDEAAKKAANRGSWFGWMNKGGGRSVSGDGQQQG